MRYQNDGGKRMTREEAIEFLRSPIKCSDKGDERDLREAMDMAIKSLKQEPCDDCISRHAVLYTIFGSRSNFYNEFDQGFFADKIRALPPVTPAEKVGHWIYDDDCREHGHCSECGYGSVDLIDGKPHNYCSNCGIRMEMQNGNTDSTNN